MKTQSVRVNWHFPNHSQSPPRPAPRKAGQPTDSRHLAEAGRGSAVRSGVTGCFKRKACPDQESMWGWAGPRNIKGPGRDHLGAAGGRLLSHRAGLAKLWPSLDAAALLMETEGPLTAQPCRFCPYDGGVSSFWIAGMPKGGAR